MSRRPLLHYAPDASTHKRRIAWRGALVALFLIVAFTWTRWLPPIRARFSMLYWQHQAMRYSAPANDVVLEDDPPRAAALLKDRRHGWFISFPLDAAGQGAMHFARSWERFYELYSPPGRKPGATLFLHARNTPAGERRLVAVDTTGLIAPPGGMSVEAMSFRPGVFPRGPAMLHEDRYTLPFTANVQDLRIFAGQPDPADPSHFTIDYISAGARHVLDGWVQNDDHVVLEARQ